MVKSELYDIVSTKNLRVSILDTCHFSIGTSPYYAHQHGLAIDIYQDLSLENYNVLSPVSGKIIKIKEILAPKPKFPNGINKDYLLLISSSDNSDIVFKILHVKPGHYDVDQKIEVGDVLGKTIRNGYFAYWSSPHLHLEIRSSTDAVRARGGKTFSLAIEHKNEIICRDINKSQEQIPVEVQFVFPEFLVVTFPQYLYYEIKPFFGVKGTFNHFNCILDSGLPLYKNGMVHFQQDIIKNSLDAIYLNDIKIGTLYGYREQFGFFKLDPIKLRLNNSQVRGISLFLSKKMPLIKIIPFKKNQFSFNPKSIQYLSIS
jgi:hypothetical protein